MMETPEFDILARPGVNGLATHVEAVAAGRAWEIGAELRTGAAVRGTLGEWRDL